MYATIQIIDTTNLILHLYELAALFWHIKLCSLFNWKTYIYIYRCVCVCVCVRVCVNKVEKQNNPN